MTIKKRLFWSNILMVVVPVMAALATGFPEDSGAFSWGGREERFGARDAGSGAHKKTFRERNELN